MFAGADCARLRRRNALALRTARARLRWGRNRRAASMECLRAFASMGGGRRGDRIVRICYHGSACSPAGGGARHRWARAEPCGLAGGRKCRSGLHDSWMTQTRKGTNTHERREAGSSPHNSRNGRGSGRGTPGALARRPRRGARSHTRRGSLTGSLSPFRFPSFASSFPSSHTHAAVSRTAAARARPC